MKDPKKYAITNAVYWLNQCFDFGLTAEEIVARAVSGQRATRRNEKKRGKEEDAAAACEGEKSGNPSYEQVEKYAATSGISQTFAKAWYDRMNRDNNFKRWMHPTSGRRINNWRRYLAVSWKRRGEFNDAEPVREERPTFHIDISALEAL